MKDSFATTSAGSATPQRALRVVTGHLFTDIWIVPGVAILILALFVSLGRVHASEVWRHFASALIYSAFIATSSSLLVGWIAFHFTARHPRLVVALEALALLFTATFGCFAAGFVLQLFRVLPHGSFWPEFRASWPFAIVITLVIGLSMTSFEKMRYKLQAATLELRTHQVEHERANKLLAEARLSSLESRIHPHFLFNTLNSIASLIPSDPVRAEATVSKLASLLRFSLNTSQNSLVPLAQEIEIVRNYLEIESTRFGPRLRYEIVVPDSLGSVKVPPLALQSLVENSVKHVAARRSEGATIEIAGSRMNGRVQFEVADDGPGFSLTSISPEHGLGNLSARLQLLFGDAGQLDVTRDGAKTITRISFPAET